MESLTMFEIIVGIATIVGAIAAVIAIFNSGGKKNKQIMIGGRNNKQANGDIKNEHK